MRAFLAFTEAWYANAFIDTQTHDESNDALVEVGGNDAGSSWVESVHNLKTALGYVYHLNHTWACTTLDCRVATFRKVNLLYYTKDAVVAQSKPLKTSLPI